MTNRNKPATLSDSSNAVAAELLLVLRGQNNFGSLAGGSSQIHENLVPDTLNALLLNGHLKET